MMKMITPPEDEAVAKNYIAFLRQGQFDQIRKDLDPKMADAFDRATFEKMRALIPAGEPTSVKVVGAYTNVSKFTGSESIREVNLTFEYQFPGKWLLINVATRKQSDVATIIGFRVQPLSDSMENVNKFTLAGKSPRQYAMLALVCFVPLLILCALIACIRTKMLKRKWLWIIFILIGIGKVTMNWSTGKLSLIQETVNATGGHSYNFDFLSFQLFGASAFAQPYGPWILSVSLPFGAILFLLKRKSLAGGTPPPFKRQLRMGSDPI